ncbi:MAG: OmpA family protein [Actinomycetota bacterium]|nr:OmpA family protein [Actinomycetota bacterium]
MNVAALMLTSVLALATACGGGATRTATAPAASGRDVTAPSTTGARPDLPTVPGDDRRSIPRVSGDDAAPPDFTTRTTVLDDHPALVVTVPEAVLFAFGSAELRVGAEVSLQRVVELFDQHPGTRAEVAGHTDSVGSAEYNLTLSQERADAVVAWLAGHGVPRAQLRAVGYGATRPVAGNATDDDRQRNRRVEITVRDI